MAQGRIGKPFEITVEQTGDVTVMRVTGELVAEHEEVVDEAVRRVIATGAKEVLMDLRNVSFIDSLGVRALIRSQRRPSRTGLLTSPRSTARAPIRRRTDRMPA